MKKKEERKKSLIQRMNKRERRGRKGKY